MKTAPCLLKRLANCLSQGLLLAVLLQSWACHKSDSSQAGNPDSADPCRNLASFKLYMQDHVSPDGDLDKVRQWQPLEPATADERPIVEWFAGQYLRLCGPPQVEALTSHLIAFPTVRDGSAGEAANFAAMESYLQQWSNYSNLHFHSYNKGAVWQITLGKGDSLLDIVTHGDVVPPGQGWNTPPFEARRDGERLYGRGSEDDKGPLAAVMVVLRTLSGMGLQPPKGSINIIVGTYEETDWSTMQAFTSSSRRAPITLSLDSSFPVVVAEDGLVSWHLAAPKGGYSAKPFSPVIVQASAGEFITQVPEDATLLIAPAPEQTTAALTDAVQAACTTERARHAADFACHVSTEGARVRLRVHGKAVHSSLAERGSNALYWMARMVDGLDVAPNGAAVLLQAVARYMVDDLHGKKLGIGYSDALMGDLLVVPTVLRGTADGWQLDINMRRPQGRTSKEFSLALVQATQLLRKRVDRRIEEYAPRLVGDPEVSTAPQALVNALLDIYRAKTGETAAQPVSMRGATYARLFKGAVSFGPVRPGKEVTAHGPNEYIEVRDLAFLTDVYTAAIFQLTKELRP